MKTNTKVILSTLALSLAMASTALAQRGPGNGRDRGRNDHSERERDRGRQDDSNRFGNQRQAERKAANLVNSAYRLQNIVERYKDNRERITSPTRRKASFLVSKSRQLERVINVKGVDSLQAENFMDAIKSNFREMKGLLYGSRLGDKVRYEMSDFQDDMQALAREL